MTTLTCLRRKEVRTDPADVVMGQEQTTRHQDATLMGKDAAEQSTKAQPSFFLPIARFRAEYLCFRKSQSYISMYEQWYDGSLEADARRVAAASDGNNEHIRRNRPTSGATAPGRKRLDPRASGRP